LKKNEEVLRASLADYEATIRKQEKKYDMLKSHAMAQLERLVIPEAYTQIAYVHCLVLVVEFGSASIIMWKQELYQLGPLVNS
jgi:hypothetical protein